MLCAVLTSSALAGGGLPEGFVYLRDVDPTITQDIRYAGSHNFLGRPAPGYEAGECILAAEAARALSRVQRTLNPQGLSLKVYDCYRPARAVRAFVAWANAPGPDPDPSKSAHYPRVTKPGLLEREYIAAPSGHSLGTAVDLTIIRAPGSKSPEDTNFPASPGACTAPKERRAPDNSVDMGTGFDCFDALSHTANSEIGGEQRRWRSTLVEAMEAEGFQNYPKEWWHFSLSLPDYDTHRDFPVSPRPDGG